MDYAEEVIAIHKKVGAILMGGHFVGTSGKHFDTYILKDALYPHTAEVSRIGEIFALVNRDLDVSVVVAPALGGIILSQWTAFHLSRLTGKEMLGVYTEKTVTGEQTFTRGYDALVRGKRVLVVEDNTTTGGSVLKVMRSVRDAGGEVAAVSVMVNRDPELVNEATFGVPFHPLTEYPVRSYDAAECPLCRSGVPVNTTVGHGKKFLAGQEGKNP